MMNIVVMGMALVLALWVELLTPAWAFLGQAKAPVVMSVVLYYALRRPLGLFVLAAGVGGLGLDGLSGVPLGCSTLALCVVGAVARRYRTAGDGSEWFPSMALGALAGMGVCAVTYLFLRAQVEGFREISLSRVGVKIAGMGLLSMIGVPLVHYGVEWLDKATGNVAWEATNEFERYL